MDNNRTTSPGVDRLIVGVLTLGPQPLSHFTSTFPYSKGQVEGAVRRLMDARRVQANWNADLELVPLGNGEIVT